MANVGSLLQKPQRVRSLAYQSENYWLFQVAVTAIRLKVTLKLERNGLSFIQSKLILLILQYFWLAKTQKRPSTSTYHPESPPIRRDRHDSGRCSMKSDDLKATVKIERSPPVFPEAVGSRGEMTPDEFYAQSLRLDFPRSTLGKIRN